MLPELFTIPFLGPVSAYQTFLALGMSIGIWLSFRLSRQAGEDPNIILDLSLPMILSALFGARFLYYFEFYDRHFRDRPWYEILYVHQGGYVFYGGFICAVSVVTVMLVRIRQLAVRHGSRPVHVARLLDVMSMSTAIGLGCTRVGCLLNGCCYGRRVPEEAWYGIRFPQGSPAWVSHVERHQWIGGDALWSLPVHATQIYECAAAGALTVVLYVIWRMRPPDGVVSASLLSLYGCIRFTIERLRDHDPQAEMTSVFGSDAVTYSQIVSVALVMFGVAWGWKAIRWDGWQARRPIAVTSPEQRSPWRSSPQ